MSISVARFYGESGGGNMFDSRYLTPELAEYLSVEAEELERVVMGDGYTHLIEVGCGYGRYLKWAASRKIDYEGIDLVSWMVDLGKLRVEQTRRDHPSVRCDIYNIPVESLAAALYSYRAETPGRRTLVFFPFNCFGNLENLSSTVYSLQSTGADVLISTFQTSPEATRIRATYYEKCGYTAALPEVDERGVMIASPEGLRSYAYEPEYIVEIMAQRGYGPVAVRPFSGIGRALHFRWAGATAGPVAPSPATESLVDSPPIEGKIVAVSEPAAGAAGDDNPADAGLLRIEDGAVTIQQLSMEQVGVRAQKCLEAGTLVRISLEPGQFLRASGAICLVAEVGRVESLATGWWKMIMKILAISPRARRRLAGAMTRFRR